MKTLDKFRIGYFIFIALINGAFVGGTWYAFSHEATQAAVVFAVVAGAVVVYLLKR
jgi:hypothetical protein